MVFQKTSAISGAEPSIACPQAEACRLAAVPVPNFDLEVPELDVHEIFLVDGNRAWNPCGAEIDLDDDC